MNSRNPVSPGAVQQRIATVLAHIGACDGGLHAFVELDADGAMERARALDSLPEAARGPLHGMPLAVKEVIDAAGRLCGWGSPIHAGRRAAADAPLLRRLIDAGAVPVGITASTEYALAAAAATVHPRDPRRSPGASSSGSAAAVGSGMVPVALGTQTIGSIIRPAAYCGVVGFKPSHGRYSTEGMLCLSQRLDHAGLLAASVADVMAVDAVLGQQGEPSSGDGMPGLRVLDRWFDEEVSPAVSSALAGFCQTLRKAGFALGQATVDADIAAMEAELTDTLLTFELAQRHGAVLRAQPGKVSAMLLEMLARGEAVSASRFDEAVVSQREVSRRCNAMLRPGEIALAPATVGVAPLLEEGSGSRAPQRLWTLAGMPSITVPVGEAEGLPVGLQLIGRTGEDAGLLQAAARIEAIVRQGADV